MFRKKIFLPIMLLILALSLVACTTDTVEPDSETVPVEDSEDTTGDDPVADGTEDVDDSADESTADNTEDPSPSEDVYGNIQIKAEEAFDIYMEKYPTTKVKKIQIEKEMGKYIYEVEGFEGNKEYEIKIDSTDGTITKDHVETDDDMDDMEITRANVEKVAAIVEKALSEVGEDAVLEEWTIEFDDGIVELEVEIDGAGFDNQERTYNVETGQLIEIDD